MSDIQQYLLDYDRSKKDASVTAEASATRLQNRELKLLSFIQELGEYLVSEDGAMRAKTMAYLAEVLSFVPQKVLSLQQRNLLCDFIVSRFEDSEGLGSCAKALIALEELGKWEDERAVMITESLLNNTHPLRQYKSASERYAVLRLLDKMMANYRDVLRNLQENTPGFLSRFIAYFDGEKDPRNLMMVFSILRAPMAEWNISADAQELFEAVFNYFPIAYRPPSNDVYGITVQDLKDRLRDCISATPDFAPYAIPALLDKLDTPMVNAKRDALTAITSVASEYGPRTMALYSITLWDALKFEVLNVQEESLAEEALNALAAIARTLSQGTNGPLQAYLRPIAKECNEHLEDAPTKQSQASARFLKAIANVSPEVTNIVFPNVLPNLLVLYQNADTTSKRRGLLEVFVQLVRADIDVYGSWRSLGTADQSLANALTEYKDQALDVMLNGLNSAPIKEVSFRLVCLDGLLQMSKARQLLSDNQIGEIIQLLHSIVIHEESYGKDEVKEAAINGLVEIAHQKPEIVIHKAFPAFLAELPDKDEDGSKAYVPVLEAFAKLASEEQMFGTVILRVKNKFSAAVKQGATPTYLVALLSALLYALTQGESRLQQDPESSTYFQDIVLPLLQRAASSDSTHPAAFDNETTLDLVGRICNLIVRPLNLEQHDKVAVELYTLFTGSSQSALPPFQVDSTSEQGKTLIVSTHVLASLRKEATLPVDLQVLISSLVDYSQIPSLSPVVRSASLRQLSLICNKFIPASSLKSSINQLLHDPGELFSLEKLDSLRIRIIFAILKGVVPRNSPFLSTIYPEVLAFLSHPQYGKTIAHGFTTLLQPDDLLTKVNHCQISGLHKQKSFALLVPNITAIFSESSAETKPNCLIALSGILKWMPFDIVVEEVERLVPLLLQSLDLSGEDLVKEAAIDLLLSVLREKPKVIEEYIGSLISRLLNNSTTTATRRTVGSSNLTAAPLPPPKVRTAALKCLTLVPDKLRHETVLPYRRQVTKRLTFALDDRKREVRGQAVKCRRAWLDVDEVDDDE
ncbi:ARM repeat-containing protein [Polyplosphaeria fusca]|uniref:MMS19 nucleotide excision repair protein n=1 Tax=Polyplosphaeria fusca TaxID=682080 RepID=A0A9P4QUR3_9PLEO|nr:ARM repeat-containing protein [Polyplosphaeria fusca]